MKWAVKAGRAARSDTKSKTSSRGAEMVADTETSRMRARSYRPVRTSPLGGAAHDREPAVARVHALGPHRDPPFLRQRGEAEVAQRAPALELVHALAGQWSPPASAT